MVDPSLVRWALWVVVLLAGRVPQPVAWASFLLLNGAIRRVLYTNISNKGSERERRLAKLANGVLALMLLWASADNVKIPKDYVLIYIWINYYGELNPPTLSVLVSPTSRYLKVNNYKNKWIHKLYHQKEFVIFPLIYAQILSNYLTPTKYKLNQKYLSSLIKSWVLNPIWINYSLGVKLQSVNWLGLLKSYLVHNGYLIGFIGLTNFKTRFVDKFYELKYSSHDEPLPQVLRNFALFVLHKANSLVNFTYLPNLIAMVLILLTAPALAQLNRSRRFRSVYLDHVKLFFKSYTKVVGVVAGFVTLYINSMNYVPDYGYHREAEEPTNIRQLSKLFMDALDLYLFRLILLLKWRITKENHPVFKKLRLQTWNRLESAVMCYGVWKVMNLNDFVERNPNHPDSERLRGESLVKLVGKVTNN